MKTVKVLGSGCKNCTKTADMIQNAATEMNIDIQLEKITDIADIMSYGVMSTPGVIVDDTVVHAGGLPTGNKIKEWLK